VFYYFHRHHSPCGTCPSEEDVGARTGTSGAGGQEDIDQDDIERDN
jgi:hypothetical protein